MMRVHLSAGATHDLEALADWVADGAGEEIAQSYVQRLEERCRTLEAFANRGTPRDDLGAGLRTIPFERQAVIVYSIEAAMVLIVRILHRGRDLGRAFEQD